MSTRDAPSYLPAEKPGLASADAFCATTFVPAVPATIPPMSASDPIAARLPVLATKRPVAMAPVLRGAPGHGDTVHVGGHEEQVHAEVVGQQFAGQVLVDDGFNTDHAAGARRREHGGDTPTSRADDHGAPLQQPADRL